MLNVLLVVVVIITCNSFQLSQGAYIFVKVLDDDNFSSESEIVFDNILKANVQENRVGMRSLNLNEGENINNGGNENLLPEPNESAKSLNLFHQIIQIEFFIENNASNISKIYLSQTGHKKYSHLNYLVLDLTTKFLTIIFSPEKILLMKK